MKEILKTIFLGTGVALLGLSSSKAIFDNFLPGIVFTTICLIWLSDAIKFEPVLFEIKLGKKNASSPRNHSQLAHVKSIVEKLSLSILGTWFDVLVEQDQMDSQTGRIYLQIQYDAPCTLTGLMQTWEGRKWYLDDDATDDQIIKTAYAAFEAAVKHEVMEGFKVGGTVLFNPHTSYQALLQVSGAYES